MKADFTPSLSSPKNGVNFWTNGQICSCIFTSISYDNCVFAPVLDQQLSILNSEIIENFYIISTDIPYIQN